MKRIRAGRPQAKISVGSVDGPSLLALGKIVEEPATLSILFDTFARKYPGGWKRHEAGFRKGFADGSRVLVRYVPE